ncbi:PREDICTED: thylakoid lumenal 16.5 kDa protein, chloroplastic [Nicotiana attenuata]|uniref:Thylakoid lumenal 16.5 kDa protein, chloroplastic n=1 Tax=Nicotiana attenuata TaxID=49451 RepID=A0A314L7E3_NICAT|nr:PREDICTED: thylakoid lumenal 16.5 kDa protein, chloroplastic [Nicotiana attenuata]OIT37483.1 thylakoid lumenal 16.5 kda protein, chloroplastic [Nicotiana attenuata]
MATVCLSNPKSLLPSLQSSSLSNLTAQKISVKRQLIVCKAENNVLNFNPLIISKRSLSISLASSLLISLAGNGIFNANAAILEADEDDELMEKVKKDRKKRLERQGIINSSTKEKGYLQDLVYKLSIVGQAIEKNDLSAASSVLGQSTDADWVQKVNSAFNKFSGSDEEKTEIDSFNSSLSSLVSSVTKNDIEGTKTAFLASASAFEKWTTLTGLIEELKGL